MFIRYHHSYLVWPATFLKLRPGVQSITRKQVPFDGLSIFSFPAAQFLARLFYWKNSKKIAPQKSSPAFHPKRSAICPSEVCLRCPCRILTFSRYEDQCAFTPFLLEEMFQINTALRPTSACRTMPLVHGHGKCMVNFKRYLYIIDLSKGPSSSVFSGTKSCVQALQNHKIFAPQSLEEFVHQPQKVTFLRIPSHIQHAWGEGPTRALV